MRLISSLFLAALLFQSPPATQETWPPAGVLTEKDVSAKPAMMRRVEPAYTPAAMRAQIQGFVTLQFIVETDGSVREVHVITSLDPNGLDEAAIRALKLWKFKPGMKNGEPVRVLETFMQVFQIRDLPPPMTLPAGFDQGAKSALIEWVHAPVLTDGLVMEIAYPGSFGRVEAPGSVFRIMNPSSMLSVGIQRPTVLPAPIPFPMPVAQLAQFSEVMRMQQNAAGTGLESVAAGQVTFGTSNWLWLEMESSSLNALNVAPELAAIIQNNIAGVHVWAFSTSVNSRLVQVMCIAPTFKSPAARDAGLAMARSDCSEIIKRMSITAR